MSIWFEDLRVDDVWDVGTHHFTAEAIKAFAAKYDPQRFHLDEAAAADSIFGGLCASGWHTAGTFIRQMVDYRKQLADDMSARGEPLAKWGPSPGFRDLKWIKPVYAGDTLAFSGRIAEKIDLKSRPSHGLVRTQCAGINQHGDQVFAITTQMLVERRTPFAPA